MVKDPICKMDVSEEDAEYMLRFGNEIFYFCSESCKDAYREKLGLKETASKKGFIGRYLEKLAEGTKKATGGKPPRCH